VTRMMVLGLLAASCGFDAPLLVEDRGAGGAGGSAGSGGAASDAAVAPDAGPDAAVAPGLAFAVGEYSTCAVVRGEALCWGAKTDSGDDFQPSPVRVALPEALVQVTAGRAHACGISVSGSVYCWGDNETAQLGSSDPTSSGPVRVGLPARARKLSSGTGHNCAILEDGTLWCWGSNSESQLGTAELELGPIVATPTQVGIASDYLEAACGDGHSCALRAPGALYCWGRNSAAQLGIGSLEPGQATTPLRAGSDSDWVAITSAQEGGCGRKRDGRIFCWGRAGADGGLVLAPLQIGDGVYTSIATSTFHTCATKSDQSLWCWGRNVEGQLAIGSYDEVPGMVRALGTGYLEVGVGRFHTCALDAGGRLLCAGKNDVGQLGQGDTVRRPELTAVPLGG
jgi:alpha-tubulin suppressor-like RCC1 family protein